jgi:hypothetical protein
MWQLFKLILLLLVVITLFNLDERIDERNEVVRGAKPAQLPASSPVGSDIRDSGQ